MVASAKVFSTIVNVLHMNLQVLPTGVTRRAYSTRHLQLSVSAFNVLRHVRFPFPRIITVTTLPKFPPIHLNLSQFCCNNIIQFWRWWNKKTLFKVIFPFFWNFNNYVWCLNFMWDLSCSRVPQTRLQTWQVMLIFTCFLSMCLTTWLLNLFV